MLLMLMIMMKDDNDQKKEDGNYQSPNTGKKMETKFVVAFQINIQIEYVCWSFFLVLVSIYDCIYYSFSLVGWLVGVIFGTSF